MSCSEKRLASAAKYQAAHPDRVKASKAAYRKRVAEKETKTGLCKCGCGGETKAAIETCLKRGRIKGEPVNFIKGHQSRMNNPGHTVDIATGCWN